LPILAEHPPQLTLQVSVKSGGVVKGPVGYIGGKSKVAAQLVSLFPPRTTYVEPFAGGAQVFFHKERAKVEVLNDLNVDIVNLFRVCQSHYEELVRYLRFTLTSRQWFQWLQELPPGYLTDIQRAARFFYLQKHSFAACARKGSFRYVVSSKPYYRPHQIPGLLQSAHERLQRVQIECLPYEKIFTKYDRSQTFFYCDPPYYGLRYYEHNFSAADFVSFEERLRSLKGKFLLSLNDHPEVRRLFRCYDISHIDIPYSTAKSKKNRRHRELLIKNY
jgi:DNA adenine methylase